MQITWDEDPGSLPRDPSAHSPAARSGAQLVPLYRAPELLPVLYHAGHDSSRQVPRSEEKREIELLAANEAKDCLLGCRSPTNSPTRRSSESLDYAQPTRTRQAGGAVRHWYAHTAACPSLLGAAPGDSGWRPTASSAGCSLPWSRNLQDSVLGWRCVKNHGQDRRIADKALAAGDRHAFQGPFRASGFCESLTAWFISTLAR